MAAAYVVVVVENNQFSKSQVSRQTGSFAGDTLLETTITADDVWVVVEQFVFGCVVGSSEVGFCHGQSDGVGDTLSQWTGRNLHSCKQSQEISSKNKIKSELTTK